MHFFFQILWSYIDVVFDWNICFTNCQPIKIRFSETHGNIKNMSSQKKTGANIILLSSHISNRFPARLGWKTTTLHPANAPGVQTKDTMNLDESLNSLRFYFLAKKSCATRGWGWTPVVWIKYYAQKIAGKASPVTGEMDLAVLGWWTSWTMDHGHSFGLLPNPWILGNHHLLAMANDMYDMLLPLHSAGTPIWSRIYLYLPCYTPGR